MEKKIKRIDNEFEKQTDAFLKTNMARDAVLTTMHQSIDRVNTTIDQIIANLNQSRAKLIQKIEDTAAETLGKTDARLEVQRQTIKELESIKRDHGKISPDTLSDFVDCALMEHELAYGDVAEASLTVNGFEKLDELVNKSSAMQNSLIVQSKIKDNGILNMRISGISSLSSFIIILPIYSHRFETRFFRKNIATGEIATPPFDFKKVFYTNDMFKEWQKYGNIFTATTPNDPMCFVTISGEKDRIGSMSKPIESYRTISEPGKKIATSLVYHPKLDGFLVFMVSEIPMGNSLYLMKFSEGGRDVSYTPIKMEGDNLPILKNHGVCVRDDGSILITGGLIASPDSGEWLESYKCYEFLPPQENGSIVLSKRQFPSLSTIRFQHKTISSGDTVILFGGLERFGNVCLTIDVFQDNFFDRGWRIFSMPFSYLIKHIDHHPNAVIQGNDVMIMYGGRICMFNLSKFRFRDMRFPNWYFEIEEFLRKHSYGDDVRKKNTHYYSGELNVHQPLIESYIMFTVKDVSEGNIDALYAR